MGLGEGGSLGHFEADPVSTASALWRFSLTDPAGGLGRDG